MSVFIKKRRINSGLSRSDIANELGIDFNKYILIERGEIKMPTNLIDKFNEIINRGINENKLIKLEREKEVTEWFKNMTSIKNGKLKIQEKMDEFNISTFKELSKLMGYKDSSIFSHYVKLNSEKVPYDFKNNLYSFFKDELNAQPKKKTRVSEENQKKYTRTHTIKNMELKKWYNTINLEIYMKKNGFNYNDMAELTGVSATQINRLSKNLMVPRESTLLKLKHYFDKVENDKTETTTVVTIPDTHIAAKNEDEFFNPYKERLTTKYTNLLNFNYKKIDEVNRQIKELQDEIIALTKEKTIFENVLKDIKGEN